MAGIWKESAGRGQASEAERVVEQAILIAGPSDGYPTQSPRPPKRSGRGLRSSASRAGQLSPRRNTPFRASSFHLASTAGVQKSTAYSATEPGSCTGVVGVIKHRLKVILQFIKSKGCQIRTALRACAHVNALPLNSPIRKFIRAESVANRGAARTPGSTVGGIHGTCPGPP